MPRITHKDKLTPNARKMVTSLPDGRVFEYSLLLKRHNEHIARKIFNCLANFHKYALIRPEDITTGSVSPITAVLNEKENGASFNMTIHHEGGSTSQKATDHSAALVEYYQSLNKVLEQIDKEFQVLGNNIQSDYMGCLSFFHRLLSLYANEKAIFIKIMAKDHPEFSGIVEKVCKKRLENLDTYTKSDSDIRFLNSIFTDIDVTPAGKTPPRWTQHTREVKAQFEAARALQRDSVENLASTLAIQNLLGSGRKVEISPDAGIIKDTTNNADKTTVKVNLAAKFFGDETDSDQEDEMDIDQTIAPNPAA